MGWAAATGVIRRSGDARTVVGVGCGSRSGSGGGRVGIGVGIAVGVGVCPGVGVVTVETALGIVRAVTVASISSGAAEILPSAGDISSSHTPTAPSTTRASLAVRAASLLSVNDITVVPGLAASSAFAAASSTGTARYTLATVVAYIATTSTVTPFTSWTTFVS